MSEQQLRSSITYDDRANAYLTPSKEEQMLRILRGECPHSAGWEFLSYGHNSNAYRCVQCGYIDFH